MKAYTQSDVGGRGHNNFREVEVFGHRNGICLVKDGGVAAEMRWEFLYASNVRPLMRIDVSCIPSLDNYPEQAIAPPFPWQALDLDYIDIIGRAVDRVVNRGT